MQKGEISPDPLITYLEFYSKIDCDLTNDSAIIEMSFDQKTWLNIGCDSNQDYIICFDLPQLSGTNNEWKLTHIQVDEQQWFTKYKPTYMDEDTLYFKFTFRSDGFNTNKEGWVIDKLKVDMWIQDYVSIDEKPLIINIYPNPCTDFINILLPETSNISFILLYNFQGQVINRFGGFFNNNLQLDFSTSETGLYTLHIITQKGDLVTKRIIKH